MNRGDFFLTRIHVFHQGLVFYRLIFFLVYFWVNWCVFPLSDRLRALPILLSYCLSIRLFRYVYGCHIFVQNRLIFLLSGCFRVIPSHLLVEFPFIILECPVLSGLLYPFISLIFHILPIHSGLFPQVVLLFFSCVAFSFLALHVPAAFLCFISLACFRRFLSAFSVEFPILVLIFSLCLLRGTQFSHKLISPLHSLAHLIRLYY